jgi:hypothetical protein
MADYNSSFTGAQIDAGIGLANTATQPGDLATVATSGDYDDLINLPTLGTAAATASTDYATAAQGSTADSAVQPGDNVSDLTNDAGYVPSDPTGVTGADAITNIMSLTQAEYDAIVTPDAATLYVIV